MKKPETGYWIDILKHYRLKNGFNQMTMAGILGVDQTTISRWESGRDIPSLAAQRRIRDLLRREVESRQDMVVRARVRHSAWPSTIVRRGAVFVECNQRALREVGMFGSDLRGETIYGHFGPHTDEVTERWERTGIFNGEIALTISLNELKIAPERSVFVRTMDTPHITTDGDIWCVCELQRIAEPDYRRMVLEFGADTLAVPFDAL